MVYESTLDYFDIKNLLKLIPKIHHGEIAALALKFPKSTMREVLSTLAICHDEKARAEAIMGRSSMPAAGSGYGAEVLGLRRELAELSKQFAQLKVTRYRLAFAHVIFMVAVTVFLCRWVRDEGKRVRESGKT